MQTRPILVADLGGTHARFLLAGEGGFDAATPLELPSAGYPDLDALMSDALKRLDVTDTGAIEAMLAVAGPVQAGRARLTNLPWSVDAAALGSRLGFRRMGVINDLAAAAWALSDSPPGDARRLKEGTALGRCAVISVSTGLGTAYWSKSADDVQVDAAEGGHAGFAADEDWAFEFLHYLQRLHGRRISWERALSGSGLAALDAQLRGESLAVAEVTKRAKAGEDSALKSVGHYSRLLGTFAGDLVLAAPAPGGVWLMGGVLAGLGAAFDGQAFLRGFGDKGRLSSQLAGVPVHLTDDDRLGLRGAWALARRQQA